jgi:hypothetical protein
MVVRLLYAAFWTMLLFLGPPPPHREVAAQAFWSAIEATGFLVPLLGVCYFAGGLLLWMRRTSPLGLAILSPPMVVIILFDLLLAKEAGLWIALAVMHGILLWEFRSAFSRLWSYV